MKTGTTIGNTKMKPFQTERLQMYLIHPYYANLLIFKVSFDFKLLALFL